MSFRVVGSEVTFCSDEVRPVVSNDLFAAEEACDVDDTRWSEDVEGLEGFSVGTSGIDRCSCVGGDLGSGGVRIVPG